MAFQYLEVINENNIIRQIVDAPINPDGNLAEILFNSLQKNKHKIAQIDSETGEEETFEQFLNRCIALAQALKKKGLTTNDVVSYCCLTNMDYLVVIIACIFTGVKFSGLDVSADSKEITHCLNLIEPKILFCDPEYENIIVKCLSDTKYNCDVIVFKNSDKNMSFNDFLKHHQSHNEFLINKDVKMKDASAVVFTSGTSGPTKAAEIPGYNLYYGSLSIDLHNSETAAVNMIFTLPSWISNFVYSLTSVIKGYSRVIYRTFNPGNFLENISRYKVNLTILTKEMLNVIVKQIHSINYDVSSVNYIIYGGSVISETIFLDVQKLFPNCSVINLYGMTETACAICRPAEINLTSINVSQRASIGIPNPGFFYKVVDPNTEEPVGPNKEGEMRIKMKCFFKGYLKNPEKTKEAFDENGFFKTGDIVYYDDNYNFYIVDRIKEIFKYSGWHVSTSIIENQLLQHPDVVDVAVVTIPHDLGEIPIACIKIKDGAPKDEKTFIKFIENNLAVKYHLRGGVKFVDVIPKTPRGKLLKRVLKEKILNP